MSDSRFLLSVLACSALLFSCKPDHKEYSGIYPHLAFYNSEGECGTGAVVPWGGNLWVVTYSPHMPFGSDDKLYEISEDLDMNVRPESIGGTPANRMVHKESGQLFIGPYVIDGDDSVRVLPYGRVPGRHTGLARHLSDPGNRILLATMEAGFYDIDVHSLNAEVLFKDGNVMMKEGLSDHYSPLLPGYHGKGFYSGQGVAVYSNNGEEGALAMKRFDIPSGSLSEYDGNEWKVIRRNQFTEVTGPGGLYGNASDDDPIWALGWDCRSVILALRESSKGWTYYRLPKASFSYDGAHGWNTEWPRIRNIGDEEYLMTMHGMFWHFPGTFSSRNSAGIRPRGSYLKIIGDFCEWNGRLVFGCDDAARSTFLNARDKRSTNTGQSNSNLWFTPMDGPDNAGPTNASGYVWLRDTVMKNAPSDPFIFQGWDLRSAWIANRSAVAARVTFEVDDDGNDEWRKLKEFEIGPQSSLFIPFAAEDSGVWIRAVSDNEILADLSFTYAQKENRSCVPDPIFDGLPDIGDESGPEPVMYGLPDNRRALALLDKDGNYYEIYGDMNFVPKTDSSMSRFMEENISVLDDSIAFDGNSVLMVDPKGRRWRLPYGDVRCLGRRHRICREVTTERSLLSLFGTFYELPAENADGYAKIRPVSSHHFAIKDYVSYRGLLVLSGAYAVGNPHIVTSTDRRLSVWAGAVDDLWKLGKPVGTGGPWYKSHIEAGIPSDPYLIGFYDDRSLVLSNDGEGAVVVTLEADPTGDGQWFRYMDIEVGAGQSAQYSFPDEFQARWIRLTSDRPATVSAVFTYR